MKTYFYTFHQKDFDMTKDDIEDWREYVIFEAESAEHANYLAQCANIYNDKWNTVSENDGKDYPYVGKENIFQEMKQHLINRGYFKYFCEIYFLKGKYMKFRDKRLNGEL